MNRPEEIKDIMSIGLTSTKGDTPVKKLKNIFKSRGVHHILVEDENGALEGIISTEDFLRTAHFPVKEEQLLARHIMTVSPRTVSSDTSVAEVIEIFLNNYFRSIPVVNKSGGLVGIVTPYDILAMLSQTTEV